MRDQAALSIVDNPGLAPAARLQARSPRKPIAMPAFRISPYPAEQEVPQSHAEVFYLQKQIQSQTPMVVVLEDGERLEGCIEWYDRNALKVRGRQKTLVYKSTIKYMFKLGESGQPERA